MMPTQNGWDSADDIFACISVNENHCNLIRISLAFVPKCVLFCESILVQVMACCQTGHKSIPEPMRTKFMGFHQYHITVMWYWFHCIISIARCIRRNGFGNTNLSLSNTAPVLRPPALNWPQLGHQMQYGVVIMHYWALSLCEEQPTSNEIASMLLTDFDFSRP